MDVTVIAFIYQLPPFTFTQLNSSEFKGFNTNTSFCQYFVATTKKKTLVKMKLYLLLVLFHELSYKLAVGYSRRSSFRSPLQLIAVLVLREVNSSGVLIYSKDRRCSCTFKRSKVLEEGQCSSLLIYSEPCTAVLLLLFVAAICLPLEAA